MIALQTTYNATMIYYYRVEMGATEHDVAALVDLEVVYNCIEERENDFKVAAQIGQMLVERNSQLMEEIEGMKRDWETEVDQYLIFLSRRSIHCWINNTTN